MTDDEMFLAVCEGADWTLLQQECDGRPEVWDQTIGCPKCGMNIWNLPKFGSWPEFDRQNEPPADWWHNHGDINPYEPYFNLFFSIHKTPMEDSE